MNAQTTQTANASEFRGCQVFHVWSRVWPSYNRTYCGTIWGFDVMHAGNVARETFGNGKIYDLHDAKHGKAVRKGA